MNDQTRQHEHEIEIAAPPDAVWRAIAEPEEMKKWYVEDASLEPRQGGAYHVSWGGGLEAHARIDAWEPNRRLRLVADLSPESPMAEGYASMVEEFSIEVRGDRTVLRVLHAGIPSTPDWDGFYDSTNAGWETALHLLRFVVERHPGKPVRKISVLGTTEIEPSAAWSSIVGPDGIFPKVPGKSGEAYEIETSLGDVWSGVVVFARAPDAESSTGALTLSVSSLGDAAFHAGVERMGNSTLAAGGVYLFGAADEDMAVRYRDLFVEKLSVTPMHAST